MPIRRFGTVCVEILGFSTSHTAPTILLMQLDAESIATMVEGSTGDSAGAPSAPKALNQSVEKPYNIQ